MKSNAKALYIHIPFCKNICSYCDFKKIIYNQKIVDEYFESLFFELEKYKNSKYKSIYIGGGTPSCIDSIHLNKLLNHLSMFYLDKKYKEFTVECNVEDINESFLNILISNKVNRLSIGVQTFNEKYIKICNRKHTKEMAIDNITLASKYIKNVSIDMIYAFPFQSLKELNQDLDIVCSLPIKHISYYSLLIEPNTIFWNNHMENLSDDIQEEMYTTIYKKLEKYGLKRYEISNFSKNKKYQSFHNKTYWKNEHYDAVGLSASGYTNNIRYTNTYNIEKYIKKSYDYYDKISLTKEDIMFNEIMLRLRLDEGLDINHFNKKYKEDFLKKYESAILFNIKNNTLVIIENKIKTTFKGSLLLNSVLECFLPE